MYSVDAIPCQGIQPLSLAAQILYTAIQLPLHRGAKIRAQYASAALPLQNVRARRALIRFSCARRARFIHRRCASCAKGVLHLRSKRRQRHEHRYEHAEHG